MTSYNKRPGKTERQTEDEKVTAKRADLYRHDLFFLAFDDVIDPAETRQKIVAGLRMLRTKREELPRRKHGNVPL